MIGWMLTIKKINQMEMERMRQFVKVFVLVSSITFADYRNQENTSIGDTFLLICSTIKKPKVVSIHPSSSLFKLENPPEFVLYAVFIPIEYRFQELVFTTKEYIRIVSEIQISWLKEIAPHYYNSNDLEDESKKKMPKLAKKN